MSAPAAEQPEASEELESVEEAARRIRNEMAIEAGFAPQEAAATKFHSEHEASRAMDAIVSHPLEEAVSPALRRIAVGGGGGGEGAGAGAGQQLSAAVGSSGAAAPAAPAKGGVLAMGGDGTVFTEERRFFGGLSLAMSKVLTREDICDVVFEVGPMDGTAEHARLCGLRGVLAARSEPFRALLFAGEHQHRIHIPLPQWHAGAFRAMLEYTHAGRFQLDATCCVELLALAAHYELDELRETCAAFIEENLHHGHACYMMEQASKHDPELFARCLEFIAWNCTEVIETEGFFVLSEPVLGQLLDCDELHMPNEMDLYHAIVEWGQRRLEAEAEAGLPARPLREVVGQLIGRVRLGLIAVRDLNAVVRKDGLVDSNDLMDALLYHTDNLSVDLSNPKFHPRVGRFDHTVCSWTGTGEGSRGAPYEACPGLLHLLGTGLGQRAYSNPYPSEVLVFSSGMHEDRPGHSGTFVGMEAFVANKVGSLFTSDAPMSWVGVTLKHGRMIIPSHYSLGYHDVGNDMFAPRSWELQGSNDGMKWATLVAHQEDSTLGASRRVWTWPVPYKAQQPFAHFRILQTGTTMNHRHLLSCSGLELYGRLLSPFTETAADHDSQALVAVHAAAEEREQRVERLEPVAIKQLSSNAVATSHTASQAFMAAAGRGAVEDVSSS